MHYDSKIAIVVSEDIATWQKLNAASFLAGGLVSAYPQLGGESYQDGSGRFYGPLIRQPILIFQATPDQLRQTLARAQGRGVRPSLYTRELFSTGNDADNRAAVAAVQTDSLDLVGLALHGARKDIDKIVKGLALHR